MAEHWFTAMPAAPPMRSSVRSGLPRRRFSRRLACQRQQYSLALGKNSNTVDTVSRNRPPRSYPTATDAVAELERRHGPSSHQWTYHDSHGEPVGVVVRWELSGGNKDIRPASRHGDGWRIGGMPEPRPLYGLPDLAGRGESTYAKEKKQRMPREPSG